MSPIITALSGDTQIVSAGSGDSARGGTLFVRVPFDCLKAAREERQRNQFRLLSETSRKQGKWPFPPEPDLA
jgi:hypothetical protein